MSAYSLSERMLDLSALTESVGEILVDLKCVDPNTLDPDELLARTMSTLDRVDETIDMAERFRAHLRAYIRRLEAGTPTQGAAGSEPTTPEPTKDRYIAIVAKCNAELQAMGVTPAFLLCADSVIYDTARMSLEHDRDFYESFSTIMATKADAMHNLMDLETVERDQRAAAGPRAAPGAPSAPELML
jgi:hypothetical protein